ncbi:proteinase-activated receptor 3 [Microcaecilia unicolor]|uniref:Proteinase-activated receptor 3-like n=1 Tax=Microcaecilia unicolor TaxID=1415580 RepID=A0A6P7YKW0_9AMPH|nr:proteinase-activated receptor 3-like [Microcaecilia unicolor]
MTQQHVPVSAPAVCAMILLFHTFFSLCQTVNSDQESNLREGRVLRRNSTRNNSCKSCLDASNEAHLTGLVTTKILPIIYSIILLIGLPANGLAFWVLAAKTKKIPSTFLLMNLSIADLFFVLVLPLKVSYYFLGNNWLFGEILCRATSALFYGNIYCSILFLMCISVDRYISLVHPLMGRGLPRWKATVCVSFGIWFVVIAAVTPFLLQQQSSNYANVAFTTCHDVEVERSSDWFALYFLILVICGFTIPFVVTVYCYGAILIKLIWKKKDHRRVTCLLVLVLLTFILCFSPSNIMLFLHSLWYKQERHKHNQLYIWYTIAQALSSFSACIDPFIYYYASQEFRTMVKSAVCCCKKRNRQSSGRTSDELILNKSASLI